MSDTPQESPQSDAGSPLVGVVMGEDAARALAAACQLGKFRIEDWLDSGNLGHGTALRMRAERAREWLDWGQRWLVDGTRIDVPPDRP